MVTQEGLEPPTLWFVVKYSNPTELLSHLYIEVFCNWWAHLDSNQGPTGYEPVALTNWAIGPSLQKNLQTIWSGKRDSNSRPPPWQGDALPTELFPHFMERKTRLELATPTLARWCSTNWAISAFCLTLDFRSFSVSRWLTKSIISTSSSYVNTFFQFFSKFFSQKHFAAHSRLIECG